MLTFDAATFPLKVKLSNALSPRVQELPMYVLSAPALYVPIAAPYMLVIPNTESAVSVKHKRFMKLKPPEVDFQQPMRYFDLLTSRSGRTQIRSTKIKAGRDTTPSTNRTCWSWPASLGPLAIIGMRPDQPETAISSPS